MNTLSIKEQSATDDDSTIDGDYEVSECTMSAKSDTHNGQRKKCSVFEGYYKVGDGREINARFGGKYTQELLGAARTVSLNDDLTSGNSSSLNDRKIFVRSTADFFVDFSYGTDDFSRIQFHDTLRFRHKWGGYSEISTVDTGISVAGLPIADSGDVLNKHVIWTREAWIKIALSKSQLRDDFIQMGLLPYSVGRGISLGSAYKTGGFLGFSPGFSIDQYAPGILVRCDLYPKRLFFDSYFALLENKHISYESNNESIRTNEILENGASDKRGTNSFVYLLSFKSKMVPMDKGENKKLVVEPYYAYQHGPDQKVEFINDSASFLKAFGVSVEFDWNRFKCGGELGVNRGVQEIKPWDRNEIKIVKNDDGVLIQQYTKVNKGDTTTPSTELATVNAANAAVIATALRGAEYNGANIHKNGADSIWSAIDRFRPRQEKRFEGWFALFDASYEIAPEKLTFVWGTGWVSGELADYKSVKNMSKNDLMNQTHSGFVAMQSVYSGTRLRHLVMINADIPRFAKQKPWESSTDQNIVAKVIGKETLTGMANLYFIGGNLEWVVQSFEKYDLQLSPNVIHYWSPESPLLKDGSMASASLGTELALEVSMKMFEKIKFYSFGGVFFPGKQYTQMKEAGVLVDKIKIGDSPAYIVNIGATFAF